MNITAIITAGGTSSRYGKSNKLLEKINTKTVIETTIDAFLSSEVNKIIVCANQSIIEELNEILPKNILIVEGGKTRQESVYNGLCACKNADFVLIHDGARPVISTKTINEAINLVKKEKALTVVTKTTDTIKIVGADGKVIKTLDRNVLYNTQTPQAFEYSLIRDVHEKLKGENFTDDAGMVENFNIPVHILDGGYKNIKITTQSDLELAKTYLKN